MPIVLHHVMIVYTRADVALLLNRPYDRRGRHLGRPIHSGALWNYPWGQGRTTFMMNVFHVSFQV